MSTNDLPPSPVGVNPTARLPNRVPILRAPRGRPRPLLQVRRWLRILGPGLVTGAADDDPSGIGTYSQAGAAFGTGQLWLALYMLPLLIAVQEMCARIGLVTGKGIAAVVRQHYSRKVLYVAVALVFLANTLNIGADLGAMAATVQLLVPGAPFLVLLVPLALGILALEIFVPYRRYAVVLKLLRSRCLPTSRLGSSSGCMELPCCGRLSCRPFSSRPPSWRWSSACWERPSAPTCSSGRPPRRSKRSSCITASRGA